MVSNDRDKLHTTERNANETRWIELSGAGTYENDSFRIKSILTYSMEQSPLEADWFAASQEIPRISRNPKVHYRTHKRPPPVSILGEPNPD